MTATTITVLHVDDSAQFTELVREYVGHHHDDIVVRSASNGDDALAQLGATDDIDCVVSDYEMPRLNGLELLETVRERWPDLPFVLFTGQGSEDVAARAIGAGVSDYLQKRAGTDQIEVLVNRIRNAVALHRVGEEHERTSRWAEAQFELMVETVEDYAIFSLDEDGFVQTWNSGAEKIKGYTADEIIGRHFSVFYPGEAVADGVPERNLREAAAEGRVVDEGWRVRKDGSEFWANVTITALREEDALVGYAKVTRDGTQRKREQELLEQKEQLEDLIAAISHDLRTPLAVARGNVDLAVETGDLSRLDATTRALVRAGELLDYLSLLAQEGKQIMEPESVDLREVAERAWQVVETETAALDVAEGGTLLADPQRLQQLLENLFRNAVKHAGDDVSVRVGRLGEGGFYVEDDGPGVPEAKRSEVFEMGYSDESGSTGFGLAICKQIAEAHGWFIGVADGTDGGARFEVSGVGVA
jgi:PAS domain S-box-containing protein